MITVDEAAKTCTKCGETKALAAFSKEKRSRDGLRRVCKVCEKANSKAWREKNKERARANSKAWYEKNKERDRANSKAWREKNKERDRANSKAWYEKNKERARANEKAWYEKNKEHHCANSKAWREKNKERARANEKAWREQNRDKARAIDAARRARRRKAEPVWLSDEHKQAVSEKYALSVRLAEERGEEYHVDHIWPLKGKGFRGLHVPWNLQVIPASENLSKHNNRPVDQNYNERPACKWSKTLHDY